MYLPAKKEYTNNEDIIKNNKNITAFNSKSIIFFCFIIT